MVCVRLARARASMWAGRGLRGRPTSCRWCTSTRRSRPTSSVRASRRLRLCSLLAPRAVPRPSPRPSSPDLPYPCACPRRSCARRGTPALARGSCVQHAGVLAVERTAIGEAAMVRMLLGCLEVYRTANHTFLAGPLVCPPPRPPRPASGARAAALALPCPGSRSRNQRAWPPHLSSPPAVPT